MFFITLNNSTVASFNSFTITSSNGSFVNLVGTDGTYAIYVSDSGNNYCYGQFTIKMNTSNKWETITNSGISYNASNVYGTIVFQGGSGTYTAKVTRLTYTPSNATIEALNNNPNVNAIRKENVSLNTLTEAGLYCCQNCTDTPNGWTAWLNVEVLPHGGDGPGNPNYPLQIVTRLESNERYIRFCSNGTWSAWVKEPTRAEIDALNSKLTLSSSATNVNVWTNNTNAALEIFGITKKFTINVASNGTVTGSVSDI